MVLNNIEQLITKYLNGETSLKEEAKLKHYFNNETVPSHLKVYQPLFNYFTQSQTDSYNAKLPLQSKLNINYKWLSIAALFVISFGLYFNYQMSENDLGTFNENETEIAYNQFVSSLQMVSKNFNKGTSTVTYLKEIETANKSITYLNEMQNPIGRIIKVKP